MTPDPNRAAPGDEATLDAGDAAGTPAPDDDASLESAAATVEADLVAVAAERDDYLEALRRTQADLENYKKRVIKQQTEHLERAAEGLVEKLLPVLDACDSAIRHGASEVEPVFAALLGTLEKEGLSRIHPEGQPFDPTDQEAVLHEGGGGEGETIVTEVIQSGYAWKGRVLRPAMVKVEG